MQTFLPYLDYKKCAAVLDRLRLGKQRLEARQILSANTRGPGAGWYSHPVTKGWRGFELDLAHYGMAICSEWAGRGYRDEQFEVFLEVAERLVEDGVERVSPPWVVPAMCSSHRSALLGKDFAHYSRYGWTEQPTQGYEFPATLPVSPAYVEPVRQGFCPRCLFPVGDRSCPEPMLVCRKCSMKNIWLEEKAYV